MNHDKDVMQLNKALKGEHIAIESFDHYIQGTRDEGLKKSLLSAQQQHQFHAMELSEKIHSLGGNPVNTAGAAGIMAELKYKVMPGKHADKSIIGAALQGEKMGLSSYTEIYKSLSDPSSKQLTKDMMEDCVKVIEELNAYNNLF